jgi:predicted kinase
MKNSQFTLALMAGLPGVGKSTLAYTLSRALNWHVIDKDRHKEVLLKQGWDDEKAGIATYELAFETARIILMRHQASVILDSAALHSFILENALSIVESVPNAQLKVILCVADRDLRNKRLRSRPLQTTNITVGPETIADYLRLFQHLPPRYADTLHYQFAA